ncbi:11488_t:CDS:2 [Scutellospora calospora]|uniref:11488_t:CDS:1 n=1 Tax=Scutellospora calospora TaxID=85575 RepID=A0ACA9K3D4_9GLOM|nr:11488_t:CDS:2 [Scutellospora calospora]
MSLQVLLHIINLKCLYIISISLLLIQLSFSYPNQVSNVDPRWGHTATLINDTIYFVGGRTNDNVFTSDFISLKISNEFSINLPPWMELDSTGMPRLIGHTAVAGGLNNTKIVVFGGGVDDPASAAMQSLTIYDPTTILWTRPTNLMNSDSKRRYLHSAVILSNHQMLMYGGQTDSLTGSQTISILAELWGLDTISLYAWQGFPSLNGSPNSRERHTASVIGNKMIILGGSDGKTLVPMSEMYVFDSNVVNWTLIIATGQVPTSRIDHSAVASADNTTTYGDIAILDTDTWKWSAPPTINPPPSRTFHTATIVGANMIIAFGRIGSGSGIIDDKIYCLNLLNWTWVDKYIPQSFPPDKNLTLPTSTSNPTTPNPTSTSTITPTDNSQFISIPKGLAIGILTIISLIGAVIIAFIIFYINRQRKISDGSILVGIPYSRTSVPPSNNVTTPTQSTRIRSARYSFLPSFFRQNDGEGLNQIDIDENITPQNSIFAQTLLRKTSNNNVGSVEPENDGRRNVRFNDNNITITPVVYTKGHHTQESVEIELGNTNEFTGNGSRVSDIITQTDTGSEGSRTKRLSSRQSTRESFDSNDIVNIGSGLDVQRQSADGASMVVLRNQLRITNPDIDQEDNN